MKTNWQTKKLGEVCDVIGGGTPSKANASFYAGDIPWATVRDMKNVSIKSTEFMISETAVKNSSTNIIPKNNVVIATRVGLGKVCFLEKDTAINQDLRGVIPKKSSELSTHYLFWWFKNISDSIIKEGTGATVQGVKLPFIKSLGIPLPPLSEQKRIVKTLDDVFEKLAKAKENAEKNLQNSKDLFESYLQSVFANPKLDYNLLGDVCKIIGGGTPSKDGKSFSRFYNGDIPWATVRDMRNDIIQNTEHKITKEAVKNSSTNIIPKNNVVIATRVGLGKICFITRDTAINQDLRGVVPVNSEKLSVMFLFWWLKSISQTIIDNGRGATVHGVTLPFIKGLKIPSPSIVQQKAIVKKLDALSTETKKLEKIYEQKLADLEELKKSVLRKAFAGEL